MIRLLTLLLMCLLAAPLEAQTGDSVRIVVVGRVKTATLSCPNMVVTAAGDTVSFAYAGDTISCTVKALDSTGARTFATFSVTSSSPGVASPIGTVTDTILRLRLVGTGSTWIKVAPVSNVIGGVVYDPGKPTQRFVAGRDIRWPTGPGIYNAIELCGYRMAAADTLAKSSFRCPGSAPVQPFTFVEVVPEPARQIQALVRWGRLREEGRPR